MLNINGTGREFIGKLVYSTLCTLKHLLNSYITDYPQITSVVIPVLPSFKYDSPKGLREAEIKMLITSTMCQT